MLLHRVFSGSNEELVYLFHKFWGSFGIMLQQRRKGDARQQLHSNAETHRGYSRSPGYQDNHFLFQTVCKLIGGDGEGAILCI